MADSTKQQRRRKGAAAAVALLTTLCGSALWFASHESSLMAGMRVMNADEPVCESSKIKVKTRTGWDTTDTGIYFCNGADKGCNRLDKSGYDDFESGETDEYAVSTVGGSSDWFCVCGTRDQWGGTVQSVQLCDGVSYSVSAPAIIVSNEERDAQAFECAKFDIAEDSDASTILTEWKPVLDYNCGLFIYRVTISYKVLVGNNYLDTDLKFVNVLTDGTVESTSINRWSINDWQSKDEHKPALFNLALSSPLGEYFCICTTSKNEFKGSVLKLNAPAPTSLNYRGIMLPDGSSDFFVKNDNGDLDQACALYSVDVRSSVMTYARNTEQSASVCDFLS